jgi:hypothetical protein
MSSQPSVPPDDPVERPSYEVGYGKPPQATRFQPGKSGNPKGRPRGSRKAPPVDGAVEKLKALALQEAYRPIKIKDGETLVELPTIQAALRNLTLSAAKGDQRAQRMLLDFVGEVEGERQRDRLELFEAAVDCKRQGAEQIALARLRGLPEPVLVPHPDHIIINFMMGSVKLRGPLIHGEWMWDWLTAMEAETSEELADLERERAAAPRSRRLKERIEACHLVMARMNALINFEWVLLP